MARGRFGASAEAGGVDPAQPKRGGGHRKNKKPLLLEKTNPSSTPPTPPGGRARGGRKKNRAATKRLLGDHGGHLNALKSGWRCRELLAGL